MSRSFFTSVIAILVFLNTNPAFSSNRSRDLKKRFEKQDPISVTAKDLKGTNWSCDMHGARSKKHQKKQVPLYSFDSKSSDKKIENKGSQVVKSYQQTEEGWVGRLGPLKDSLRKTPDGKLIARLSLEKSKSQKPEDISYTICRSR